MKTIRKLQVAFLVCSLSCWLAGTKAARAQQTNLFIVYGEVFQPDGHTPVPDGYSVGVINKSRSDTLTAVVGDNESGKYDVVFMDFLGGTVAEVGDTVEITLYLPDGTRRSHTERLILDPTDIQRQRVGSDIISPPAGVLVYPVTDDGCEPGQQCLVVFGVTNAGQLEDSFHLSITLSHPDWPATYPTTVGPVAPGETTYVDVVLSIPDTLNKRVYEEIILSACSHLDTTTCASATTFKPVAAWLQSHRVSFQGGNVEVSFTLAAEAWDLPFELVRRARPAGSIVIIPREKIEATGNHFRYLDSEVEPGATYSYSLAVTADRRYFFDLGSINIPSNRLVLHNPFPNPFSKTTTIELETSQLGHLKVSIYDVQGKLVRRLLSDEVLSSHRYKLYWDGRNQQGLRVEPGVYMIRVEVDDQQAMRKIVHLR